MTTPLLLLALTCFVSLRSYKEGDTSRIALAIPGLAVVMITYFLWFHPPIRPWMHSALIIASIIGVLAALTVILPACFASRDTVKKHLGKVRFE